MTSDTDKPAAVSSELVSTPRAEPEKSSLMKRLADRLRGRNAASLREDLTDALSVAENSGETFTDSERAMLNNILRLREVRVEDVLIPRSEIISVEIGTTLGELLELFESAGHSRMPVYAESLDDPRGMVHIRDIVAHVTQAAKVKKPSKKASEKTVASLANLDLSKVNLTKTIAELNVMRKVLFVPHSMPAAELMTRMRDSHIQMALVIDEYGGTDGLVSLEDIVEMVVGNIEDEHDDEEVMITKTEDGVFIVDARADLEEVQRVIGEDFEIGEIGEDVDTLGGLITAMLGRVPPRGEVVQAADGYEFHVLEADPRRVRKVRIVETRKAERRRRQKAEADVPEAPSEQS
jgi:CBS domain containing-hemolysin-like protein